MSRPLPPRHHPSAPGRQWYPFGAGIGDLDAQCAVCRGRTEPEVPAGHMPVAAPPQSAADRRALWARADIADDELSVTVLAVGLRPSGDGPLARVGRVRAGVQVRTCARTRVRIRERRPGIGGV
ncbi:TIGR02679 domain-containing protein [Streptomyces sp. NBC_00400]|uniref:TIGR02679 domain-containing protein n=1 Tax=Streptomyces sp. NBC_00400 TaxID=2975737 RepID=UPI003FA7CDEE